MRRGSHFGIGFLEGHLGSPPLDISGRQHGFRKADALRAPIPRRRASPVPGIADPFNDVYDTSLSARFLSQRNGRFEFHGGVEFGIAGEDSAGLGDSVYVGGALSVRLSRRVGVLGARGNLAIRGLALGPAVRGSIGK